VPDCFGGVGAWRAHRNSAVFYATEIAAAKMLLFFWGVGVYGYFDRAGLTPLYLWPERIPDSCNAKKVCVEKALSRSES